MQTCLLLANAAADNQQGLVLMVVGMVVVFVALTLLLSMISLVNRLMRERPAESVGASAPAPAESQSATMTSTGGTPMVDKELIAVISAAVTMVVRRPSRVRRIRFVGYVPGTTHGWVAQGRSGIMTSHRPHLRRAPGRR